MVRRDDPAAESVVTGAPEPPRVTNPGDAVGLAPHDLDTLSVYADSLAATDPALGDYIALGVQAARLPERERAELEMHARELFATHGRRWLAAWNTPNPLFKPGFHAFCNLPCSVRLEGLPADVAALDAQLAHLPIRLLVLWKLASRGLVALGDRALLRRITTLVLCADSRYKLAKPAVSWLAKLELANLRALQLVTVAVTGSGVREIVDHMPQLRSLDIFQGELSAVGLATVAEAAVAGQLEELALGGNRLESAVGPLLARFPKLQVLDLSNTDLGDDLVEHPPPVLAVTDINLDGNARLGALGFEWLVLALPELRALRLPREVSREAIARLLPLAPQLVELDARWSTPDTVTELVARLVPATRELRSINVAFGPAGLVPAIVETGTVTNLELGAVDDNDIAALAEATSLVELRIHGGSDAQLVRLSRARLGLEAVRLGGRAITAAGIAAVLAAPWPLRHLVVMYASIADAAALPPVRDRPLQLMLYKCEIPRRELELLQERWGDRLTV